MSVLKRASRQTFTYMSFRGIGICVSMVSFPIMTRIFDVSDYGNLALVNITVTLLLAISKSGIVTALVKNFPDCDDDNKKQILYSSALGANIITTILTLTIYFVLLIAVRSYMETGLFSIFLLVSTIILFRNIKNLLLGFLRAEEKVVRLNSVLLLSRVGTMVSGISLSLFLIKGLYGYFFGVAFFEGLVFIFLTLRCYKSGLLKFASISWGKSKKLFYYGFPLTFFELSALVNDYSDRFLISYFLDSSQLGIYSAGYNLSMYAKALITSPLWMAIFPIYTKLWKTDGKERTEAFLSQVLKYYFCLIMFVVFMVSLLSRELIGVLATDKYLEAANVVPYIIGSIVIYGSGPIINSAFFLHNKTRLMAYYTLICASLNIALNLFLIPRYGIMGAAYSSVASYLLLTILIASYSQKYVRLRWPVVDIIIYMVFALIMALILSQFQHSNRVLDLILKGIAGSSFYAGCIFLYDKKMRSVAIGYLKRLRTSV